MLVHSVAANSAVYQMRQLFKIAECSDCYIRLEPELGKAKPDMDDASDENIRQLKDAGACFIKEHVEELDEVVGRVLLIKNFSKNPQIF